MQTICPDCGKSVSVIQRPREGMQRLARHVARFQESCKGSLRPYDPTPIMPAIRPRDDREGERRAEQRFEDTYGGFEG